MRTNFKSLDALYYRTEAVHLIKALSSIWGFKIIRKTEGATFVFHSSPEHNMYF
jgi:hypothetical protein